MADDTPKYIPPQIKSRKPPKTRRQANYWVKNFQLGNCISCGKSRDKHRLDKNGKVLVEKSAFKRRCNQCGIKDRIKHQQRLGFKPWRAGSRGRPPKACFLCGAGPGEHFSWCGRRPPKEITLVNRQGKKLSPDDVKAIESNVVERESVVVTETVLPLQRSKNE